MRRSAAWAHVAAIPLLIAIGAGKLTMVLGGSGQGLPFDGDWATAYLGAGPVGLARAGHPVASVAGLRGDRHGRSSHCSILAASSLGVFRSADGRRLLVALAGWAVGRAVVSLTWRDPAVVGGLPAGGLIAVVIGVASLIGVVAVVLVVAAPTSQAPAPRRRSPAGPNPRSGRRSDRGATGRTGYRGRRMRMPTRTTR